MTYRTHCRADVLSEGCLFWLAVLLTMGGWVCHAARWLQADGGCEIPHYRQSTTRSGGETGGEMPPYCSPVTAEGHFAAVVVESLTSLTEESLGCAQARQQAREKANA